MSQKDWIKIAKSLPINEKTRVRCCGKNVDAIISNDQKGFSFYCFRCGTRLYEHCGSRRIDELRKLRELNAQPVPVEIPKDFTPDIPVQHACWLYRAGISKAVYMEKGIGWSDSLQRIVIPLYSDSGELLYFQCRAVHKGQIPKYKNPPVNKSRLLYLVKHSQQFKRIVVCEDILSAIRVGKHIDACSIMGTSTSDAQALQLSKYKRVTYWLDPDEAGERGTKKGIRKMKLVTQADSISSSVDPKLLSDREIRDFLQLPRKDTYIYHGPVTTKSTEEEKAVRAALTDYS